MHGDPWTLYTARCIVMEACSVYSTYVTLSFCKHFTLLVATMIDMHPVLCGFDSCTVSLLNPHTEDELVHEFLMCSY